MPAKPVNDALADGRRKAAAGRARPPVGSAGLFALQRSAGNAAVNALLAGEVKVARRGGGTDIDAALAGNAPRRTRDRHGGEGPQARQGGRRSRRTGGSQAAAVGARGHEDGLRARFGRAEKAGAPD